MKFFPSLKTQALACLEDMCYGAIQFVSDVRMNTPYIQNLFTMGICVNFFPFSLELEIEPIKGLYHVTLLIL